VIRIKDGNRQGICKYRRAFVKPDTVRIPVYRRLFGIPLEIEVYGHLEASWLL
jgi:hypothetical protein